METKSSGKIYHQMIEIVSKDYSDYITKSEYNNFVWKLSLKGPEDSVYESRSIKLEIHFPEFAVGRPNIYFENPIFHPNIGKFPINPDKQNKARPDKQHLCYEHCIRFIDGEFVSGTLKRIYSVLKNPDKFCDHNGEVSELYRKDKYLFDQIARDWALRFHD